MTKNLYARIPITIRMVDITDDPFVATEKINGQHLSYNTKTGIFISRKGGKHITGSSGMSDVDDIIKGKAQNIADNIGSPCVIYGEMCELSLPSPSLPMYPIFDILNLKTEQFLDWLSLTNVLKQVDLTRVPQIMIGKYMDLMSLELNHIETHIPNSQLNTNTIENWE